MRAGLNRERVTQAALQVVQEDGLDGLSMRKVARTLGVEAMSLYGHVKNKADLLDALHDHLISLVPEAGAQPWPDEVHRLATAFRGVLFAHPHCVPLLATRPATTPSALRVADSSLSMLEAQGFSPTDALVAFQTVFAFVAGHAAFHTAGGIVDDSDWAGREFELGLQILVAGLRAERSERSAE